MDVDFANMALAQQLLARQQSHARAMSEHLEQYARLDAGEMGLILQLFKPINDAILDGGQRVLGLSQQVFGTGAEMMGRTRETYVDADRQAHAAVTRAATAFGVGVPAYVAPAAPSLGAAQQGAPPRYADPYGDVFQQAFRDGYRGAAWVDQTVDQVTDRVRDGLGSRRTVEEQQDASAFLVTPHADDPEIESIRWKAGILIGGVDWVFEELFGYSLLEEITKPFSGNWVRMREATMAWTHVGDALGAVASNTTGVIPAMSTWTGRGSETFVVAAAASAQAHQVASSPAGTISSLIKGLTMLSKEIAGLIMKLLKRVGDRLMRMALEAAVPVAGWIAAGVEGAIAVQEIVSDVLKAYKYVNLVYDFVSGMIQGQTAVVDSALRMADLAEGLGRGVSARV
jgi:hypothetical protein